MEERSDRPEQASATSWWNHVATNSCWMLFDPEKRLLEIDARPRAVTRVPEDVVIPVKFQFVDEHRKDISVPEAFTRDTEAQESLRHIVCAMLHHNSLDTPVVFERISVFPARVDIPQDRTAEKIFRFRGRMYSTKASHYLLFGIYYSSTDPED